MVCTGFAQTRLQDFGQRKVDDTSTSQSTGRRTTSNDTAMNLATLRRLGVDELLSKVVATYRNCTPIYFLPLMDLLSLRKVGESATDVDTTIDILLFVFHDLTVRQKQSLDAIVSLIRRWSIFRARWWKSQFLPHMFSPLQDFRNYELNPVGNGDSDGDDMLVFRPRRARGMDSGRLAQDCFESTLPPNTRKDFVLFLMQRQFLSSSAYVVLLMSVDEAWVLNSPGLCV